MTVAVAHQGSNDSDHVLLEAVREATRTGAETLAVIHVRGAAVDEDLEAAVAAGVKDAVERVTAQGRRRRPCPTKLHVAAGTAERPGRRACSTRRTAVKASHPRCIGAAAPVAGRQGLPRLGRRSASSSRPTCRCSWSSGRADRHPPTREGLARSEREALRARARARRPRCPTAARPGRLRLRARTCTRDRSRSDREAPRTGPAAQERSRALARCAATVPGQRRVISWESSVSSSPPAIWRVSSSSPTSVPLLVENGLPELQDDEVVPDQVGVVRVVGDEDDAEAGIARGRGVLQHHTGLLDAQGSRRLVEDQHPRSEVHRPSDRDTLALATGELADGLVDVLDHDAHLAQLLVGDALHVLDLHRSQRELPEVISEPRKKLRQPPSGRRRRGPGRRWRCRGPAPRAARRTATSLPSTLSVALVVRVQPRDDLDQGRLAGAVVAEDAGDLARPDLEVDAAQGPDGAVGLADVHHLDERLALVEARDPRVR